MSLELFTGLIVADEPFGTNIRVNEIVLVPGTEFQGSPSITIDDTGNIYIAWVDERYGDPDILFTYSTDGGDTFSANKKVNDDAGGVVQDEPSITVDSSGNIYIAWRDERNGDNDIFFANSTDKGDTFSTNKRVNDDIDTEWQSSPSIAANDDGHIYIAWRDDRNNERDIYFANSTDGGDTFSTNKMVNDDASGKMQYDPSIAVDDSDNIFIVWTDYRNSESDIYFANSTDGGGTFSSNKIVNDDGGGVWQSTPSIAVDNSGNLYIAWDDERDGIVDIYFANSTDYGDTFSTNKKVNDDITNVENWNPSVAADDTGNLCISWTDERNDSFGDIYFANSTDGGNTFSSNNKVNDDPVGSTQYDTHIAMKGTDNIYVVWVDDRDQPNGDIYFANSTNGGNTFSTNKKVNDDIIESRQYSPSITVDNLGKIYIAWVDERNGDSDIYYAYSIDGENAFSTNIRVNDDGIRVPQGSPSIAVGGTGKIYIAWHDYRDSGQFDIYFANSTDGGNTFSINKKVNDDGIGVSQFAPSIALDDAGNIYIVWEDHRNGAPDIYFANSTDGGNTFSTNKKVNDDVVDAEQTKPWIAVDDLGNVYIVWRDDRNGEYDIYFANSTDGGNSFSPNKIINDDGLGEWQFFPSIAANGDGDIFVVWQDYRNGNWDIYFANSTDGGDTFSTNKMVNDDGTSRIQIEPVIAADNAGNIHIVWRDLRNMDPDIYYANSMDGGFTFSANVRVNDDIAGNNQYGPSIASDDLNNPYVAWTDGRNGYDDIYFTTTFFRIYEIQAINISHTEATITWKSNKPANGTIDYGLSTAYGFSVENNSMTTLHSIKLMDLEPGRLYHFKITSYNNSSNYYVSTDLTFSTKYPIYLKPGWNMISVPQNQTNTDLDWVLETIISEYDTIEWYDVLDTEDHWKINDTVKIASNLNDLTAINRHMGIWIYIKNPLGVTLLAGDEAPEAGYVNQITLHAGWNFVGYPSLIERAPPFNLPAGVDMVQWYNTSSGQWNSWDPDSYSQDDLDLMKPGQGLWIHYSGATTVWSLEYVN